MRHVFALLLVTPLLASCSDSVTPVAPSDPAGPSHAVLRHDESPLGEWGSPLGDPSVGDWELAPEESLDASPLGEVTTLGAPAQGEIMTFGNPDAGTDFPPAQHDESYHARDRINPGTVVIDRGQKVTFHVYPGHRVAIYKPGTRPEDINVGTGVFILDPTNRLALQAAPVPVISLTFTKPGKFLVICAVRRHFVDSNMWGWVIVRD